MSKNVGEKEESYYSSASEHASSGYRSDEVVVRGERISSHTFGCPDTKFLRGIGIAAVMLILRHHGDESV